jgi:flagellar hook-associated protein 1 FlgK
VVDYNSAVVELRAHGRGGTRVQFASLQSYYTRQVSDTANSGVQAKYLDRLQGFLGKPGSANSHRYGLQQAAERAAGPVDQPGRLHRPGAGRGAGADHGGDAQPAVATISRSMRQETEGQIASNVHEPEWHDESSLSGGQFARMLDLGMTDTARSRLLDQRDRLVSLGRRADRRAAPTTVPTAPWR